MHESNGNQDDAFDANSLGSWKDEAETNSLGSWKDGMNAGNEADGGPETSSSDLPSKLNSTKTSGPRMSWADMTQEDELEEEEDEYESEKRLVSVNESTRKLTISKVIERPKLSREQREHIRFMNVGRKKDFICLERFKGKLVNILEGLELHTCIFSAAEQTRIVDHVYALQEMGKRGELRGNFSRLHINYLYFLLNADIVVQVCITWGFILFLVSFCLASYVRCTWAHLIYCISTSTI